jgi:hypothetical protein
VQNRGDWIGPQHQHCSADDRNERNRSIVESTTRDKLVATMVRTLTFLKPYCHFTFDPEICSKEASGANRPDLLQEGPEFGLEQI